MITRVPLYVKITCILLLLSILFFTLFAAQGIILPLGFSFLIAVLLFPLEKKMARIGLPRVICILLSLVIATVVLTALIMFISYQMSSFIDDLPAIKKNLTGFFSNAQEWVDHTFHVSKQQQNQVITDAQKDGMGNAKDMAGSTLGALTASLATLMLVPIYTFLFMYYRSHLIMFTIKIFDDKHANTVARVISKIREVILQYVSGLLIETGCVAVLNSAGLLIIGVPYAILLGVIGAILNLIPYIGGLISLILTAIVTLSNTGDTYKTLGSMAIFFVVQFIDNNFLVPRIIGSSVKLNALVSILAVLLGGALCGVGGMFLSLPFVATCKVIFDHVEELKPWGMLLGDEDDARWHKLKKRKPAPKKQPVA
ncbi:AI-2E family transporter [Panacibacter ginsenosidivorans]|uniref:AI-2E family transporter n=1 Tax=Panacibacter ginsenosidivorans TaxID=1813871 RepID=A0A5B8VA67_9BACT|nr:AI-2E family transporter [Panacibacter ginsenosidivorans]QEC67833.1 AI-2E family transporter [Panacibacter ginsenosidivorans]